MKHLVIAVSPDSSLDLLREFADVIVLDKEPVPSIIPHYETLYIRSHFGQDTTLPQVFSKEIDAIVSGAKAANPSISFIDHTDTIEKILSAEDKWEQYKLFGDYMPKTAPFDHVQPPLDFARPVFKHRFSSRGNGVTWEMADVTEPTSSWLIQETLGIKEELRIYIIRGKVYPVGAVRQSKNDTQSTLAVDSRHLTQDEIAFSEAIARCAPEMDIVGIDVARATDDTLYLMEVNRSPGFGMFNKLTGINLACFLYGEEL